MVPINGPMIREEATEIAKKLSNPVEYDGFKASSGWLECWKSRYGIKQRDVESESGQVQTETVDSWMERQRNYTKDTNWKISRMKTRQGVSFVRFLRKVWQRKDADARVARNLNSEWQSPSLLMQRVRKKSRLLSGKARTQDVSRI